MAVERKATRPDAPTIEMSELKTGARLTRRKNAKNSRKVRNSTFVKKIDRYVASASATSFFRNRARSYKENYLSNIAK